MIIYKDEAGNTLRKNNDGSVSAYNAEGERVNRKGFETMAKRAGMDVTYHSSKSKTRHTYEQHGDDRNYKSLIG